MTLQQRLGGPPGEQRQDAGVTRLHDAHRAALERLLACDPIANAMATARLQAARTLTPARLGATPYGVGDSDDLSAAVFSGGNLVPFGTDPRALGRLGAYLAGTRRECTSIAGRAAAVERLWDELADVWDEPRAIRASQPLLATSSADGLDDDARLEVLQPGGIESYLPAAVAMFTEELGVSPLSTTSSAAYRRRAEHLLATGRVYGIVDSDGSVLFKADIGALTDRTCQIQGVWVRPDHRGRGLGTRAMAAVLCRALTLAPSVSLYVNDFNTVARRLYARMGMRQIGELATILF